MLTAQEAFKVGFLSRCVEEQLTPAQTLAAVKQATDLFEKHAFLGTLAGKALDVGTGAAKGAVHYGVPLALAAPPILGGLAGFGLAKATDIDDTDVSDVKNQEVIEELRRQAERLRLQKTLRASRQANQPAVRSLLM